MRHLLVLLDLGVLQEDTLLNMYGLKQGGRVAFVLIILDPVYWELNDQLGGTLRARSVA